MPEFPNTREQVLNVPECCAKCAFVKAKVNFAACEQDFESSPYMCGINGHCISADVAHKGPVPQDCPAKARSLQ